MGVPANYKQPSQPINPTPADGGSSTDPNRSNYETNARSGWLVCASLISRLLILRRCRV
jgi:hypothetical protein